MFFSLPRSPLSWYGSLIEEVREGLEGAGDEVWEELMLHYSTAIVVRGSTAWVKVGYPPSRLYTAKFRRSVSVAEAVVAPVARYLIPPGEVKVVMEGASTFQAGTGGGYAAPKTLKLFLLSFPLRALGAGAAQRCCRAG
ncbi:MAG: hypothetical protein QXU72_02500 [Thermofilum sp.]